MWTAPGPNLNWVTFDFKADHVITKIRIYCWLVSIAKKLKLKLNLKI